MNTVRWSIFVIVAVLCHDVFSGGGERSFPEADKNASPRKKRRVSRTLSVASTDLDQLPSGQEPALLARDIAFNEACTMEEIKPFVSSNPVAVAKQELPYGYNPGDEHTVAANGDFSFIARVSSRHSGRSRPLLPESEQNALPSFGVEAGHRATISPQPRQAIPLPPLHNNE